MRQMGQRKPVRVFQLIAEDTIESRVLDIREDIARVVIFANTPQRSARTRWLLKYVRARCTKLMHRRSRNQVKERARRTRSRRDWRT